MSAVAEKPGIIKKVFLTDEKNDARIFALRIYIRGKPWVVTVDDYLVYDEDMGALAMGLADKVHGTMWGPILEKAWAKIKGNYQLSSGGNDATGVRAFAGVPAYTYPTPDITTEEQLSDSFAMIKAADKAGYIMSLGTGGASD